MESNTDLTYLINYVHQTRINQVHGAESFLRS